MANLIKFKPLFILGEDPDGNPLCVPISGWQMTVASMPQPAKAPEKPDLSNTGTVAPPDPDEIAAQEERETDFTPDGILAKNRERLKEEEPQVVK